MKGDEGERAAELENRCNSLQEMVDRYLRDNSEMAGTIKYLEEQNYDINVNLQKQIQNGNKEIG